MKEAFEDGKEELLSKASTAGQPLRSFAQAKADALKRKETIVEYEKSDKEKASSSSDSDSDDSSDAGKLDDSETSAHDDTVSKQAKTPQGRKATPATAKRGTKNTPSPAMAKRHAKVAVAVVQPSKRGRWKVPLSLAARASAWLQA